MHLTQGLRKQHERCPRSDSDTDMSPAVGSVAHLRGKSEFFYRLFHEFSLDRLSPSTHPQVNSPVPLRVRERSTVRVGLLLPQTLLSRNISNIHSTHVLPCFHELFSFQFTVGVFDLPLEISCLIKHITCWSISVTYTAT